MELDEVVLEAMEFLDDVDFGTTEILAGQIRYLGGMLSGYDLLKGPYAHLVPEVCRVPPSLARGHGAVR
jgi:mannosyl-oligosaccharide alpha-1,2-mannosidase